jgi:hypothetical protein
VAEFFASPGSSNVFSEVVVTQHHPWSDQKHPQAGCQHPRCRSAEGEQPSLDTPALFQSAQTHFQFVDVFLKR